MDDFPDKRDPRADARRDFPQFYLLASLEDETLMDALVMLRAALMPVMNAPRDHVPPVIRDGVEKTTDATERSFTGFREAVRACPTFQRIGDEEQAQIEREVFHLRVPGE